MGAHVITLAGLDLSFVTNLGWQLANLDGMTAGTILLCSCVVWLMLNGGSNQRKSRRMTGVTTPPGQSVEEYLKRLDKMHNGKPAPTPDR